MKILTLLGILLLSPAIYGQKIRTPNLIVQKTIGVPVHDISERAKCFASESTDRLEDLAKRYQRAQWKQLQEETDCILSLLDPKDKNAFLFRPDFHYYSVVFIAKGFSSDRQVFRILLHRNHAEAPYSDDLQLRLMDVTPTSEREFREIFVSRAPLAPATSPPTAVSPTMATLRSTYTFTRANDPLTTQLPDFTKQFVGALAGLPIVSGVPVGPPPKPPAPPPPITPESVPPIGPADKLPALLPPPPTVPLHASVSTVPIPFAQSKIEIKDIVTVPDARTDEEIKKAADELATGFIRRDARLSRCGQALAADLRMTVYNAQCDGTTVGLTASAPPKGISIVRLILC